MADHDVSPGAVFLTKVFDVTLAAAAASIDTGAIIPLEFTDLRILFSTRGTTAATSESILAVFNNDSGANYYSSSAYANSSNAFTGVASEGTGWARFGLHPAATATANLFCTSEAIIANYSATDRLKTFSTRGSFTTALSAGNHYYYLSEGTWNSTAAINRVLLEPGSNNFAAGSRVAIYVS